MGFTRRNDASQPRIHPTPPQRNRLFGKKKGKSHRTLNPSCSKLSFLYIYNLFMSNTHGTCVTGYNKVQHLRPKLPNSRSELKKYNRNVR